MPHPGRHRPNGTPGRLVLAARAPRVLAQHLDKAQKFRGRHLSLQAFRKIHVQLAPRHRVDEAARRIGVAVGEKNVGLDVEDGRAVAQIGSEHVDDGTGVGKLHAIDFHARKPDGVRAKRTTGGEHAHALRVAEPRRAHRGRPGASGRLDRRSNAWVARAQIVVVNDSAARIVIGGDAINIGSDNGSPGCAVAVIQMSGLDVAFDLVEEFVPGAYF